MNTHTHALLLFTAGKRCHCQLFPSFCLDSCVNISQQTKKGQRPVYPHLYSTLALLALTRRWHPHPLEMKRRQKKKRNMGQNGEIPLPEKVDKWWKHPDGDTIGHEATAARRRRKEIPRVSSPVQTATGHDWARLHQGIFKGYWIQRKSSKMVVILLVDRYVLMVEIRYKVEKIRQSVFSVSTFESNLAWSAEMVASDLMSGSRPTASPMSTAGLVTFHPRPATRCVPQTAASQCFQSRWEAGAYWSVARTVKMALTNEKGCLMVCGGVTFQSLWGWEEMMSPFPRLLWRISFKLRSNAGWHYTSDC